MIFLQARFVVRFVKKPVIVKQKEPMKKYVHDMVSIRILKKNSVNILLPLD